MTPEETGSHIYEKLLVIIWSSYIIHKYFFLLLSGDTLDLRPVARKIFHINLPSDVFQLLLGDPKAFLDKIRYIIPVGCLRSRRGCLSSSKWLKNLQTDEVFYTQGAMTILSFQNLFLQPSRASQRRENQILSPINKQQLDKSSSMTFYKQKSLQQGCSLQGDIWDVKICRIRELSRVILYSLSFFYVMFLCFSLQTIKHLRTAEFKPFVVFVKPPALDRLRETRHNAKVISGKDDKGTAKPFTVRRQCLFLWMNQTLVTIMCHLLSQTAQMGPTWLDSDNHRDAHTQWYLSMPFRLD